MFGGKYCTRCKGGIYTAWKTLDNKKYYHPHCFTCALCGVILESVEECGVPDLHDVYCRQCFKSNFSNNDEHWFKFNYENAYCSRPSTRVETNYEPECRSRSSSRSRSKSRNVPPADFDVLYNSKGCREYVEENIFGMHVATKNYISKRSFQEPVLVHNTETASKFFRYNENTGNDPRENREIVSAKSATFTCGLQRQNSRIPRPTSAGATSVNSVKSSSRVTQSSTSNKPKSTSSTLKSGCLTTKTNFNGSRSGTVKSTTSVPRVQKSVTLLQHRSVVEDVAPLNSKRQCAAAFTSEKDRIELCSSSLTKNMYHHNYASQNARLPSSKSILSAIHNDDILNSNNKAKRSLKVNNVSSQNRSEPKRFIAPLKPASRSFKLTFDCPICMGSLVPGNNNDLSDSSQLRGSGNVVTMCGHLFHRDCMENWLNMKCNKRCPICSAICVPEALQSVYLECNVAADLNSEENKAAGQTQSLELAYQNLIVDYEMLQDKYKALVDKRNPPSISTSCSSTSNLQNAYDLECRGRLQLQWENKKLIEELDNLRKMLQRHLKLNKLSSSRLPSE